MTADSKQAGFTLIELLCVVAIIGVLASIALPQFSTYRARGYDARAMSDCRNAATAMEAFYITANTYAGATPATLPGFVQSANDNVTIVGTATTYTITCTSPKGTKVCTWKSSPGVGKPNMACT